MGEKLIRISYSNMPRPVYEDTLKHLEAIEASCEWSDDGAYPNSSRSFRLDGCRVSLAYQENHGNQGSIHMIVSDAEPPKVDRTFGDLERVILKLKKKAK